MPVERVRLRIRNVANAVLVSGQAYQEPKDALNEFVSNAADEYLEMGARGGRITITLRRRGKRPVITISDDGRGMSADRLRDVAQGLFSSVKAGDERTLGEKAIGILAFQQLAGRCDIVSRTAGEPRSAMLSLERAAPAPACSRTSGAAHASFPGPPCTCTTSTRTCCASSPSAR